MAKDPAFLFYPNDYIGGTMGMTFEEKGAYMELLMMQFNRGHMTTHMIGQTVGQLWDTIQVKFIQDDKGLWFNKRLEEEQEKRKTFTESRRNNVSGKNQYSKKTKKESGHMTSHMENVNEDVIDNINKGIPTKEEVRDYFKSKGYKSESANKAFEYYETLNWHDRDGNPVKNWKNKMVSVWFKDENRDQSLTSDGKRKLAL